MNNEIKEKIKAYYVANDIDEILDYITNLQEENDIFYDTTMKDIKENLIARIQRQECEIHNLQQKIDKAVEYLGIDEEILETCEIYDVNGIEVYKILKGSEKE